MNTITLVAYTQTSFVSAFQNLTPDLQSAVISGGIGLLGAVIGALATLAAAWLAKRLQVAGKVALFARIVYSKGTVSPAFGCYQSSIPGELFIRVPLWIDIINTCGIPRIVRDLNLHAYVDKKEVAVFTQIQHIGDNILGSNGAYTFVIPANSACRYDVEFVLKNVEIPNAEKNFDEIVLSYFDEKNCIHAFHFLKINFLWNLGELGHERGWIAVKKRCPYANH